MAKLILKPNVRGGSVGKPRAPKKNRSGSRPTGTENNPTALASYVVARNNRKRRVAMGGV